MKSIKEKTLVIYAYFENAQSIENLNFFLKHGTNVPDADYLVVVNGKISIDYPPNITFAKRENEGYDFGAWTHGLSLVDTTQYNYFIFVNSTVRGPFLPSWVKEKSWIKALTEKINNETKLVGTTINCLGGRHPHVQSMLLATDQLGLEIAKKAEIFNNKNCSKAEAMNKELRFSKAIMNAGYNIGCMLLAYEGVDFRKVSCESANKQFLGDPLFGSSYFEIDVNPFEVLFFKTNRGIKPKTLKKYTDWINANR